MKRPIYLITNDGLCSENIAHFASTLSEAMDFELQKKSTLAGSHDFLDLNAIDAKVEEHDIAMLVVCLSDKKSIQLWLNKFRNLRIPYIFIKDSDHASFEKISVPITYLEEEKEKAPFAASFARFLGSELIIHKPKDRGTKAQRNIDSVLSLFATLNVSSTVVEAKNNSEKLELEAVNDAIINKVGMVMISASREYGLDDILFGPKERKIIAKAQVPVLVINPRGDLYALCD